MIIKRQKTFSEIEQREFNSKTQKARLRKYYKRGGTPLSPLGESTNALNSASIILKVDKGTKKTAKKRGKDLDKLQKTAFKKNPVEESGQIKSGKNSYRLFQKGDKLADKMTEEGMKKYKENLSERAKPLKEAKEAAKKKAEDSKVSIAKHEAKAAELRAKKDAGEQLKKNLKKGGKIALATGGVVAAGIGAKKLADKKKAKKEEKK